ncbi:TraI/MobA(P) family conjugative relaxase [Microvirga sp. VF16]|uniref:TraI/MobA(P) family conjugative relaxase n=1 Tax=Microvirga sp. VF16 TaxID=2807101 RepID=UPI00193DEC65|nr:TraI/MobA(P) family conjugative relaxase [Microvirga sp. VF16]QRM35859.1 relaxase/mobilization nuclease domain-containing protein [Microvirga sp. VF16]
MIVKRPQDQSHSKSRAASVRDLLLYVTKAGNNDLTQKVTHTGALNFLTATEQGQRAEMISLAHAAARSKNPCTHFILSWQESERPTIGQLDEAAVIFLREIGLESHQALYAVHGSTGNVHLHIVVNRVDPDTERVIKINKGFDLKAGHMAIARIEAVQGWLSEDRSLYHVDSDGIIRSSPPFDPIEMDEPKLNYRAADFEHYAGLESAQRMAQERAAPLIRKASGWAELHVSLAAAGFRYRRSGGGAVVLVGEIAVRASKVLRQASLSCLENRFGAYQEPPSEAQTLVAIAPKSLRPTDLHATYAAERLAFYEQRKVERKKIRERHAAERKRLAQAQEHSRDELLQGDWHNRGHLLNALRSEIAADQAVAKREMKGRHSLELKVLQGRFPPYAEWLSGQGADDVVTDYHQRNSAPGILRGRERDDTKRHPRNLQKFNAEVVGRDVRYRWKSNQRVAFIDKGPEVRVHDLDLVSILAALQMAQQTYGSFTVHGTSAFKGQVVRLAAVHGFEIGGEGLEEAVAVERHRLRRVQSTEKGSAMREADPHSKRERDGSTGIPARGGGRTQTGGLDL